LKERVTVVEKFQKKKKKKEERSGDTRKHEDATRPDLGRLKRTKTGFR